VFQGSEESLVQISGRSFLGVFRFVQGEDFAGDLTHVLSEVDGETVALLRQRIRKSDWYPYKPYVELLRAMEALQPGSVEECAAVSLRRDVASILQILRVFSSVDALVTRGFGSWGSFLWNRHCDQGRVFLTDRGPETAAMGVEGFPEIDPLHCRVVRAYLREMGRCVGAPEILVDEVCCVHRGDRLCEFRGRWGAAALPQTSALGAGQERVAVEQQ
jgi:hypothetical protein